MAGCLNIEVSRVGLPIEVKCSRTDDIPVIKCKRIAGALSLNVTRVDDPLNVKVTRSDTPVSVTASRVGEPLKIQCSLVCTADDTFYLRVSPEIIWLIPENGFSEDVQVVSNVKWTIE